MGILKNEEENKDFGIEPSTWAINLRIDSASNLTKNVCPRQHLITLI